MKKRLIALCLALAFVLAALPGNLVSLAAEELADLGVQPNQGAANGEQSGGNASDGVVINNGVTGEVTDSEGNPVLDANGKPLTITVAGDLPAGATVQASVPEVNGEKTPNVFDIKILDKDGNEWQPIDEGKTVKVSIPVGDVADGKSVNIYHILDHTDAITSSTKTVDISGVPDEVKAFLKAAIAACGNDFVAIETQQSVVVENGMITVETSSFSIYVYDEAKQEFDLAQDQSGIVKIPNYNGTYGTRFKYYATEGSVFTLEPQILGIGDYTLEGSYSSGVTVGRNWHWEGLKGYVATVKLNDVSVGDTVTIKYYKPKGILTGDADLFYVDITIVREIIITYDANGKTATGMPNPLTSTIATDGNIEVTVAGAPSAANATFKGWDTSNAGNGTRYTAGQKIKPVGDMTLYAIWEEDKYNVTFDPNGGSGTVATQEVEHGKTIVFPEAPVRENYTFLGWCASKDGSTTRYQPGTEYTVTAAAAFYAVWGADLTITISGSINEIKMMEVTEFNWKDITGFNTAGSSYNMEDVEGFHKGTTFRVKAAGDSNFNAGAGIAYTSTGSAVRFWTEDSGKTLFVQLTEGVTQDTTITITTEKDKFTVSYVPNGGTAVAPDEGVSSGSSINPNNKTTTREGYTFAGWYSDAALTQKVTGAVTITAHTTFYAKWTVDDYKISYDLDGGSLPEGVTNPDAYNAETEDFTLQNPTKYGYTFVGWIGTGLTEPTMSVTVAQGSIGNRSYTAVWERALADLTISVNSSSDDQNFVFVVTDSDGQEVTRVALHPGKKTIVVKDVPVGTYTVTPLNGWAWRQNLGAQNVTVDDATNEVQFTWSAIDTIKQWLNGYSYNKMGG